jgi:hypothetical protein
MVRPAEVGPARFLMRTAFKDRIPRMALPEVLAYAACIAPQVAELFPVVLDNYLPWVLQDETSITVPVGRLAPLNTQFLAALRNEHWHLEQRVNRRKVTLRLMDAWWPSLSMSTTEIEGLRGWAARERNPHLRARAQQLLAKYA